MTNSFVNEIILENLQDMTMSQVGRDKIGYVQLATEAINSESGRAEFLNKLYKDTEKLESVDFGAIPDSKGDITKYRYYDQLVDMIDLLNGLTDGNETTNIVSLNKLHRILLDARPDFVFGFRSNNFLIMNMYKCMAMSLYEMINICVVDATQYLRQKASVSMNKKFDGKVRETTKYVNQFIKMYESGQWSIVMKAFKSGAAAEFKANEAVTIPDSGGPNSGVYNSNFVSKISDVVTDLGTVAKKAGDTLKGIPGKSWDGIKGTWNSGIGGKSALIVGAVISLWLICRGLFYLFIHGAANIKESIKRNVEILKASIKNGSNTVDGVEAQKRMLDRLNNYSDVIDYKILKTEREATADKKKSDREEFSPQEIRSITGSDFEF